MVGLDLDGTLLTDRKEITPRTRKVISQAIAEGIVVLVATGRPWLGVPDELREFPGHEICAYFQWSAHPGHAGGGRPGGTPASAGLCGKGIGNLWEI